MTKNYQNSNAAHALINYTLASSVAAKITNHTLFPSPNEAAEAEIFDDILTDPAIYPSEETQSNLEFIRDVDDATIYYEDGWEKLMGA